MGPPASVFWRAETVKDIHELIEAGKVFEAVKAALREARDAAWDAEPKPHHNNVGKFRTKLNAAINKLQKIGGGLS